MSSLRLAQASATANYSSSTSGLYSSGCNGGEARSLRGSSANQQPDFGLNTSVVVRVPKPNALLPIPVNTPVRRGTGLASNRHVTKLFKRNAGKGLSAPAGLGDFQCPAFGVEGEKAPHPFRAVPGERHEDCERKAECKHQSGGVWMPPHEVEDSTRDYANCRSASGHHGPCRIRRTANGNGTIRLNLPRLGNLRSAEIHFLPRQMRVRGPGGESHRHAVCHIASPATAFRAEARRKAFSSGPASVYV